jgi:hypothetical protein
MSGSICPPQTSAMYTNPHQVGPTGPDHSSGRAVQSTPENILHKNFQISRVSEEVDALEQELVATACLIFE